MPGFTGAHASPASVTFEPRKTHMTKLIIPEKALTQHIAAIGKTGGYIDGPGDNMNPTQLGLDTAPVMGPTNVAELQGRWMQKLQKAERAILQFLIDQYPRNHTKEEIGAASGYSTTSSSFSNALSTLRTLELITREAEPRATEILFET